MQLRHWATLSMTMGVTLLTFYIFSHHTQQLQAKEQSNNFTFRSIVLHDSLNCPVMRKAGRKIEQIPYHIIIDSDGKISTTVHFREKKYCQHTPIGSVNNQSLAICFQTHTGVPTNKQIQTWRNLVNVLMKQQHLERNQIVTHSALTSCGCGKYLQQCLSSSLKK